METLQQVAQRNPNWSLEELVQVANALLPQFLPAEKAHTRVREDVTPRLVRYYTSQGLLDEPVREGREARYGYRHLLQVLLVRRLLAEGYGASAIDSLARTKQNSELEALLQGGVQLTIAPANPALTFLQQIQQRPSVPKASLPQSPPPMPTSVPAPVEPAIAASRTALEANPASQWTRLEILPGLELHIRNDCVLPTTAQEQQNLLQRILHLLIPFATHKRRSSKP